MKEIKSERMKESLRHLAAEFLSEESNRTSLITVTGVSLSRKGDKAEILITVFPEDKESGALEFARRRAGALREFISKRLSLRELPRFSFALDQGEKNRQRIENLSQNS